MSFLDTLWKDLKEQLNPFPGPALTPKEQQQGPTTQDALGMALPNPTGANTSKVVSGAASAVNSADDFLKWIAWIFHPLNIVRAVEFLTGLLLFYLGLRPYLDRSGRTGGTLRRVVMASPAGRTVRATQGARMGRREGQREAARMEARQRETRPQREASARERVEINRRARQR